MTDKEKLGVPASPSGHSGSAPSPKGLGHSASVLNAGFTPGPWAAHSPDTGADSWSVWSTKGPHERDLPLVRATPARIPEAEHAANARLIAAAPDLYEALAGWDKLHADMIAAGGESVEFPADKIEAFARVQVALMDSTRAALAKVDPKVAVQEDLK